MHNLKNTTKPMNKIELYKDLLIHIKNNEKFKSRINAFKLKDEAMLRPLIMNVVNSEKRSIAKNRANLASALGFVSFNNVCVLISSSFSVMGKKVKGIKVYSGFSEEFNEALEYIDEDTREADGERFLYRSFEKGYKCRKLGVLNDDRYLSDDVFSELHSSNGEIVKQNICEFVLDELTDSLLTYKAVILVDESEHCGYLMFHVGKPKDEAIESDMILSDKTMPIDVCIIKETVKDFFKKDIKYLYLFVNQSNDESLEFINIDKLKAAYKSMYTYYPLIIIRVSFVSSQYVYCVFSMITNRVIEFHYNKSARARRLLLMAHEKSLFLEMPVLVDSNKGHCTSSKALSLSKANVLMGLAQIAIREKCGVDINPSLYVQGINTLGHRVDGALGWTAARDILAVGDKNTDGFIVINLDNNSTAQSVRDTVYHELSHLIEFKLYPDGRDFTHDAVFEVIENVVKASGSRSFDNIVNESTKLLGSKGLN